MVRTHDPVPYRFGVTVAQRALNPLGLSSNLRAGTKMPYSNNEDNKAAQRRFYEKHPHRQREKVAARKAENKVWFATYRAALSCSRCPESHPATLDFHHRDRSEKDRSVSVMVARGMSKTSILREIAKCDVLCANCHRKLHFGERSNPRAGAIASNRRCSSVVEQSRRNGKVEGSIPFHRHQF